MGSQLRHFCALNRKNWINWKRTLAGGIAELICPIILMVILAVLRMQIPKETINIEDLTKFRHGLYPMAVKDPDTGKYVISTKTLADQSQQLSKFMTNGGVFTEPDTKDYTAPLDGRGPMMFFPPHCVALPQLDVYGSPVIAYVKSPSLIQKKMVRQLKAFYNNQEGLWDIIKENKVLREFVEEARMGGKSAEQVEKEKFEAMKKKKENENPLQKIRGIQREEDQAFFPNIDFRLVEFESQKELDEYIEHPKHGRDPDRPGVCFGFTVINKSRSIYELELFFNDQFIEEYRSIPDQNANSINSYQMIPQVQEYAFYSYYGFGYLQNWAANTILKQETRTETASISVMTVPMKIPPMIKDPFAFLLGIVAPYIFMLMYIPMLYRTTFRIVQEKEQRIRETMRMMGMKETPYWLSWFWYHTCISFIISLAIALIAGYKIFSFTTIFTIWLLFFLYGQAIFGIILTVQSMFTQARTAAIMCVLIYLGTSVLASQDRKYSAPTHALLSLLPTYCMALTVKTILGFEQNALGVNWDNIGRDYNNYTVELGYVMMAVNCNLWILFGLYLENVLPKQYGKRAGYCFCISSCRNKTMHVGKKIIIDDVVTPITIASHMKNERGFSMASTYSAINESFETKYMRGDAYEAVSPEVANLEGTKQFMKVTDLKKRYDNGFVAVKGINLKLYSDQIFVLLGHNGAGKTSTISLMTGLYEPTQGEIEMFGINMHEEFEYCRKFMGVCPQHDVLFELLTPQEHMEIFYDFKCEDRDPVKKRIEIAKLLKDLGVADKKNDLAGQLSGGNQRKLSVGLALCGGSKFVVFDEPTAGMDLSARRQTWTALREYKKDRIILLTTHYMDEADILGDRIGIMSAGSLVCLGSSMFLKRKYGVGYNMTMLKTSKEPNDLVMPYFVRKLGPECKKISEIQSEITLQIPKEYSDKFKKFFSQFDHDLEKLQVLAYGVSITTLEDVFMKVGMLEDDDPDAQQKVEQNLFNAGGDSERSAFVESVHHTPRSGSRASSYMSSQRKQKWSIRESMRNAKATLSMTRQRMTPSPSPKHMKMRHLPDAMSPAESSPDQWIQKTDNSGATESEVESKTEDKSEEFKQFIPQFFQAEGGEEEHTQKKLNNLDQSTTNLVIKTGKEKVFTLSASQTDDSFTNSFKAVSRKRYLLYKNSRQYIFLDIFLPVVFMVLGIYVTTFEQFNRGPSRILAPERMGGEKQLLLFDRNITMEKNATLMKSKIKQLVRLIPKQEKYFDVRYTSKALNFTGFEKFSYRWGRKTAAKMPYFYSGYKIYEVDDKNRQYKFYNFVNMTNQDAGGLYPQFMYEAIIKHATRFKKQPISFKVRSTPFPIIQEVKERKAGTNAVTVAFVSAVAFAMMLTNIMGLMVEERISRVKHIQVISGMQLSSYWAANFLVDLAKMEVTCISTVIMFRLMGTCFKEVCITYVLFPFAAIPMTYCLAFLFPSVSSAQTFTIFSNFMVILIMPTIVLFLRNLKQLFGLGEILNLLFKLFPGYTVSAGVVFNSLHHKLVDVRSVHKGWEVEATPWVMKNILGDLTGIGINCLFWFLLLAAIESGLGKKCKELIMCMNKGRFPEPKKDIDYDDDVLDEEYRVLNTPDKNLQIKVSNLRKVYLRGSGLLNPGEPLCAVENLSFGLGRGECFGLLGVNGAGKSTTFKILTGEEEPTSGSIKIQGMDMNKNFQKCRKLIGYCPQYNAIFETLSVKENIEYFAQIKGIPERWRSKLIDDVVKKLDLGPHIDKATGTLSGGNKRKVCVAIAILGNPPIILLDEPSAGMDPEARRFMWEVIGQIASDRHSAVILTSHLMEEAEALSTKMGIMVKGGIFKCFGSSQHIKNKFGVGFEVEIKIKVPRQNILKQMVEEEFGSKPGLLGYLLRSTNDRNKKIYIGAVLRHLIYDKNLPVLAADQIRRELVINFLQSKQNVGIEILADKNYDYSRFGPENISRDVKCAAHTFMEKLLVSRQQYGIIMVLCKAFGSLEVLEQYGNYMRLRVSSAEKTIGQMFGKIEDLKASFDIDQYAISQTTLEQIFQSFANLNFDSMVKTFSLAPDGVTLQVRGLDEKEDKQTELHLMSPIKPMC